MKANEEFAGQPMRFWANVRKIGEQAGYTVRGESKVSAPSLSEMCQALERAGIRWGHIAADTPDGLHPTEMGTRLLKYFGFRASVLNEFVEPRLMAAKEANKAYAALKKELRPNCPLPMNKQSGAKRQPAYLTGIVNMIVEANSGGIPCDYDPRQLTIVTENGEPLRTLARRVDGAFPSVVDPVALWEVKEYYHTTTFGSRVADGIYVTLLDGLELLELKQHENRQVKHCLMLDAHFAWWECGKSYLCRILDALHMGYLDVVLFGREVVEELPGLVSEWAQEARNRGG